MITKHFVLATSMVLFVAMSGQAYAGTTISDTRYWPSEANPAHPAAVQRAERAFDLAKTRPAIESSEQSYQGGPKGDE
jgi:hypothetical protein